MQVELKHMWFAPSQSVPKVVAKGKVVSATSGKRYRPGIHTISDSMRPFLPSSAKILLGPVEVESEAVGSLKDLDVIRAGAMEVDKQVEVAEKRRDNMEKARAARGA